MRPTWETCVCGGVGLEAAHGRRQQTTQTMTTTMPLTTMNDMGATTDRCESLSASQSTIPFTPLSLARPSNTIQHKRSRLGAFKTILCFHAAAFRVPKILVANWTFYWTINILSVQFFCLLSKFYPEKTIHSYSAMLKYFYFTFHVYYLQHSARERHLPYRITQRTCHPIQVNAPALTPARQTNTRLTYPEGVEGWVDLGASCTSLRYLSVDTHPWVNATHVHFCFDQFSHCNYSLFCGGCRQKSTLGGRRLTL